MNNLLEQIKSFLSGTNRTHNKLRNLTGYLHRPIFKTRLDGLLAHEETLPAYNPPFKHAAIYVALMTILFGIAAFISPYLLPNNTRWYFLAVVAGTFLSFIVYMRMRTKIFWNEEARISKLGKEAQIRLLEKKRKEENS